MVPSLTYPSQTWAKNEAQISTMSAVEICYLRGACGLNMMDGESNESVMACGLNMMDVESNESVMENWVFLLQVKE